MLLFIATSLALIIAIWLMRRDRNYLKKDLKEIVSSDMKKLLNLRNGPSAFDDNLNDKQIKSSKTKEILKEFNEF